MSSFTMQIVVFIFFVFQFVGAFEWSANSQMGLLAQCAGNSVTLPWNYSLGAGESIVNIRWHFHSQTDNKDQLVATDVEGKVSVMPSFADRIKYLPLAGLVVNNLHPADSGNYSVSIIVKGSSGAYRGYSQSAFITVAGGANDNTLQLEKDKLQSENYVLKDNITALMNQIAELVELSTFRQQIIAQLNLTNNNLMKGDHCPEIHPTEPFDCSSLSETESGVYNIFPGGHAVSAYCDQVTDGGGWTVFQRRFDGSLDFYKTWAEYQQGFGDPHGEYWLGLDTLYEMTSRKTYLLRVDLQIKNGSRAYATYSNFKIGSSNDFYTLHFDSFTGGTAGDSLSYHNGMKFSTKDQEHDVAGSSCAVTFRGAWWYNDCYNSNLNGDYTEPGGDGLEWDTFSFESMTSTEMKIRPT